MTNKLRLKYNIYNASKTTKKASKKVKQRVDTGSWSLNLAKQFIKGFVLVFFGFIMLFPFYYMISMALMTMEEANNPLGNDPTLVPDVPQWGNFTAAFAAGFWVAFGFSTLVMAFTISMKIMLCLLLGYAFANYTFPGKNKIWFLFILTMAVPEVAILSGQYWVVFQYGGTDGILRLMFTLSGPFIASIITAYMFRNAFEGIDDSVREAALIDDIKGPTYFFKVAIPIIKPIIWTQVILGVFASWNSYMWPALILTNTEGLSTIPIWLFNVGKVDDGSGGYVTYKNVQMAGAILAIIPTFTVYLFFRRKINVSVASGGTKG